MAKNLYVLVYAEKWSQCVPVDRVEWKDDALLGYRGADRVVQVNTATVSGVFVSEQRQSGEGANKS